MATTAPIGDYHRRAETRDYFGQQRCSGSNRDTVALLEDLERLFDGTYQRRVEVLEREKLDQVGRQNFEAAIRIRQEKADLEGEFSGATFLRRIRYALGKD